MTRNGRFRSPTIKFKRKTLRLSCLSELLACSQPLSPSFLASGMISSLYRQFVLPLLLEQRETLLAEALLCMRSMRFGQVIDLYLVVHPHGTCKVVWLLQHSFPPRRRTIYQAWIFFSNRYPKSTLLFCLWFIFRLDVAGVVKWEFFRREI